MKRIKKLQKALNKNIVDKLTKLIKPNEKFPQSLDANTVLMCMSTFEDYGSL